MPLFGCRLHGCAQWRSHNIETSRHLSEDRGHWHHHRGGCSECSDNRLGSALCEHPNCCASMGRRSHRSMRHLQPANPGGRGRCNTAGLWRFRPKASYTPLRCSTGPERDGISRKDASGFSRYSSCPRASTIITGACVCWLWPSVWPSHHWDHACWLNVLDAVLGSSRPDDVVYTRYEGSSWA